MNSIITLPTTEPLSINMRTSVEVETYFAKRFNDFTPDKETLVFWYGLSVEIGSGKMKINENDIVATQSILDGNGIKIVVREIGEMYFIDASMPGLKISESIAKHRDGEFEYGQYSGSSGGYKLIKYFDKLNKDNIYYCRNFTQLKQDLKNRL